MAWFRSVPQIPLTGTSLCHERQLLPQPVFGARIELQARITTAESERVNIFSTKAKLCEAVDVGNPAIHSYNFQFASSR